MDIVFISDTHSYHEQLTLPAGDMLIHAGDLTKRGGEREVVDFLKWFDQQNFHHKIFIAGNHDFFFERFDPDYIKKLIPDSVHYLNDSGVEIGGIKIWGSPVQPEFFDWAFNRRRGNDIKRHWDLIPKDTDLLITHGPPYGILDQTIRNEPVGCQDLWNFVKESTVKMHVFGHIHEAYGTTTINDIQFINASVVNLQYKVVNAPVKVKWQER